MKKNHDVTWAEAVRRCRLDREAERMARELGLQPKSLIRVIPGPKQRWKASVSDWVRHLYDKRQARQERRGRGRQQPPSPEDPETSSLPEDDFLIEDEGEGGLGAWNDDDVRAEWADAGDEPPWVEDLRVLARRETFRLAAQLVALEFSKIPFVERVALIGSVAGLPVRERPRRHVRGSDRLTWHEPKDVDLAVWVTAFDDLTALRRARSRAVAWLFDKTGLGVAHHQVEVFLFDANSDEYRGVLCVFGQCPKGKRECLVPHCGEAPFLQQVERFDFRPAALEADRSLVLFDRRCTWPSRGA